jgi:hypothetical protein
LQDQSSDARAEIIALLRDQEPELDENDYHEVDSSMGLINKDSVVNGFLIKIQNRIRGSKTIDEYSKGTF